MCVSVSNEGAQAKGVARSIIAREEQRAPARGEERDRVLMLVMLVAGSSRESKPEPSHVASGR